MWHGPFGVYGWIHDENESGKYLSYKRMHLHGIPRAFTCRAFGHRPVIDGYGEVGQAWPSGESRCKRWVACGRCDDRPTWQGNLEPGLFPTLGVPYTGEWVEGIDVRVVKEATMVRQQAYHQAARAWTPESGTPRPAPPVDLFPAWPSRTWGHDEDGQRGPRGAVSLEMPLVPRPWRDWPGFGAEVSLGCGEKPFKVSVQAGPLGSVYLGFEGYGRALAHRLFGRNLPATRVWSVSLDGMMGEWSLRWQLAAHRSGLGGADDDVPRWRNGRLELNAERRRTTRQARRRRARTTRCVTGGHARDV